MLRGTCMLAALGAARALVLPRAGRVVARVGSSSSSRSLASSRASHGATDMARAQRALVVLLGTHSRGDSPLQRLTTDLVRHILDLAAASSRVRLVINGVAATQPSSHAATQPSNRAGHASDAMPMAAAAAAAPPPPATLPASYAGRDLAMIANLV